MSKQWFSIPGVRQQYRWSESRREHIFEDGTPVPSNLVTRPGGSRPTETGSTERGLSPAQASASSRGTRGSIQEAASLVERLTLGGAAGAQSARIQVTTASDQRHNVQTKWQLWPSRTVDGRKFTRRKILAPSSPSEHDSNDSANDSEGEEDDEKEYKKSQRPLVEYTIGRVIEILLVPPRADLFSNVSGITPTQRFPGGRAAGVRRFVIIEPVTEENQEFVALPIKTYNGRGVAADGVIKSHHAVIYSRGQPIIQPDEQPRRLPSGGLEAPIRTQPIAVDTYDRARPIDPMSRLDFFERTTFAAEVDFVKLYGKVRESHLNALRFQYQAVWASIRQNTGQRPEEPETPRPVPFNQRVISLNEMQTILDDLAIRAARLQVARVPAMGEDSIRTLAQNPNYRTRWLQSVQRTWQSEVQARAQPAEDDDEADDDEADDDEADDNEADDDEADDDEGGDSDDEND